jgi:hypothetical protein
MTNNCLVTKLKGTVDNPNLPLYAYIKVNVVYDPSVNTPQVINFKVDSQLMPDGLIVKSVGGNYIAATAEALDTNPVNELTFGPGTQHAYFKNANYSILISNKYSYISVIETPSKILEVDLNEFKYLTGMGSLQSGDVHAKGDIGGLKDKLSNRLAVMDYGGTNLYGNVTGFANTLEYFQVQATAENTRVTGSVDSVFTGNQTLRMLFLSNMKNVSGNIALLSSPALTVAGLQNSGITGSINSIYTNRNLESLTLNKTGVSGDVTNAFTGLTKLVVLALEACPNLTGNIDTMFKNIIQANPSVFKARTNTLRIGYRYSEGLTTTVLPEDSLLNFVFTGTSTVNIVDGLTQEQIGTYNIDTNSFNMN